MKICLVCSAGGHLMQLKLLESFWSKYDRFWVTEDKIDANSILKDEEVFYGYFPTTRNIYNTIRNFMYSIRLLIKNKPDLIISNGAGIAVPFFIVGRILGIKTIYIEVIDRISSKTLTGRLVYPIADVFIVQWESQKNMYKKAINLGRII